MRSEWCPSDRQIRAVPLNQERPVPIGTAPRERVAVVICVCRAPIQLPILFIIGPHAHRPAVIVCLNQNVVTAVPLTARTIRDLNVVTVLSAGMGDAAERKLCAILISVG